MFLSLHNSPACMGGGILHFITTFTQRYLLRSNFATLKPIGSVGNVSVHGRCLYLLSMSLLYILRQGFGHYI